MRYLALLLLLAGCAIGPYADRPEYKLPSTRAVAARHLTEALAFGGRGVSEVAGDELKLTWHEYRTLTDKRNVLMERELQFLEITFVARPVQPGEWWQLEITATGGAITFEFESADAASKAEAAFRRLRQPLNEGEHKKLAPG
ncbi:MAG: hypothetical protein K8I27_11845 [Planctomycetes bacterium]|nr:hypothetical protein [Planctomycetota bacterium]